MFEKKSIRRMSFVFSLIMLMGGQLARAGSADDILIDIDILFLTANTTLENRQKRLDELEHGDPEYAKKVFLRFLTKAPEIVDNTPIGPVTTYGITEYSSENGKSAYAGPSGKIQLQSSPRTSYAYDAGDLSLRKAAVKSLWRTDPVYAFYFLVALQSKKDGVVEENKDASTKHVQSYSDILKSYFIDTTPEVRSVVIPKLVGALAKVPIKERSISLYILVEMFHISPKDGEMDTVLAFLIQSIDDDKKNADYFVKALQKLTGMDLGPDRDKWMDWYRKRPS